MPAYVSALGKLVSVCSRERAAGGFGREFAYLLRLLLLKNLRCLFANVRSASISSAEGVDSGRLTFTSRYLGSATAAGPGTRLRVAVTLSESTVDVRLRAGWVAADEASGSGDGVISVWMRVYFQKCGERKNEVGGILLTLMRRVCLRVELSMQ